MGQTGAARKSKRSSANNCCLDFFSYLAHVPEAVAVWLMLGDYEDGGVNWGSSSVKVRGIWRGGKGRFSRLVTSLLLVGFTSACYALARFSFKSIADAAGPYRLSTGVIILVAQALGTSFVLLTKVMWERGELVKARGGGRGGRGRKGSRTTSFTSQTSPSMIPPYQQVSHWSARWVT